MRDLVVTSEPVTVSCEVNGRPVVREVEARLLLSDFLRHELRLTGTHVGCEHGVCGACTVLLDGAAVRSCLMFAVQAEGSAIETVENLAGDGALNRMQQAFHDQNGLQCGFCTPGILMSLTAAAHEDGSNRDSLMESLSGHLCRCTGYAGIVSAIDSFLEPRPTTPEVGER